MGCAMVQKLWTPELLVSAPGWQQAAVGSHRQQRKPKLPVWFICEGYLGTYGSANL